MNPIERKFQALRAAGRKAFIPFLTAGDPDVQTTVAAACALAAGGADVIEIGFPYSDPIADGPVIQASYTRALANGVRLDGVFSCCRDLAASAEVRGRQIPLVGMTSYSLVLRRGPSAFLGQSKASGLSGLIVPDLPLEESAELARLAAAEGLCLIQLVTPTTPLLRALEIAKLSSGFLYCVSVTGITGERDDLPVQIRELLDELRKGTALPLCVGFGISKAEHVRALREYADGVIVGSAVVRRVEQAGRKSLDRVVADLEELVGELSAALNPV